jgi:hypothetical protein
MRNLSIQHMFNPAPDTEWKYEAPDDRPHAVKHLVGSCL